MERTENCESDSWGEELISEILGKFTNTSGDMSIDHNGDHDKHLLIGSKRPKMSKEVSKNQATAKVVRGLYPKRYTNDNKFTTNLPSIDTWFNQRKNKGYGSKISLFQPTDSIEKETKVELKDDNPLNSEELNFVQTSKKPSICPINFMENNKDSVQESYIPTIDFIEDKIDLVVVPLAPVKSSESSRQ
jgi:hypothetical protein